MSAHDQVAAYYDSTDEQGRLRSDSLELLRTRELLTRWLPSAPAEVLDVGGAAGVHALWLADRGYTVDLVDPVPKHVEQAQEGSRRARRPLRHVRLGDARALDGADASTDAVLLLGPLYHLIDPDDRARALAEAYRVLRPGGTLVAAAISRWASTLDGLALGYLGEEPFAAIVAEDVATGVHRNPAAHPGWFTTAYFHTPEGLAQEVAAAGFAVDGPVACEGPAPVHPSLLDGGAAQEVAMSAIRRIEREPSLLGASAHLLIAGTRP